EPPTIYSGRVKSFRKNEYQGAARACGAEKVGKMRLSHKKEFIPVSLIKPDYQSSRSPLQERETP
ncbi:MAG TPA: hypothetical protein DCY42_09755, partial [Chloroflexi bacterium]|nr:hypothetical protein [Chloroflexota bacterium]